MKKIFLLLVLSLNLLLFGCNSELKAYKEESINNIRIFYEDIQNMGLEYSLSLFEYEMENAIEAIQTAKNEEKIKTIEEETVRKMEGLVLSKEDSLYIKEICHNEFHNGFMCEKQEQECTSVLKYFGKYGDSIVASLSEIFVIRPLNVEPTGFWVMGDDLHIYEFNCDEYSIGVYFENHFYTLSNAKKMKIISDEHLEDIYNKHLILFDVE